LIAPSAPARKKSKALARSLHLPTPALSTSPEQATVSKNVSALQQNNDLPLVKQQVLVELPPRPPYEYEEVLDPPSKRRKLESGQQLPEVVIHYRAQKEEDEAALSKFQDFLSEIFDASDRLQPDTSTSHAPQTSRYFDEADYANEGGPRLATKIHSKLQNAIKKLAHSNKFREIPPDDVKRLQKMCEGPILQAQTINMLVGDEPSEEDVNLWRTNILSAENGLTSACTLVWTILGSIENKELCPEDMVQCLPILLTNVFENSAIPIVEARSSGRSSGLFKLASGMKDLLTRLLHQGRKLLALMADLCLQMESEETTITRIEYLATQLIFVESSYTEKDSVLGVQLYEMVRKAAMEALAKIFSKFSDQRQSILDEILSSLQKLSTTKQGARQFKLLEGKNIQLVSALVMQLVQTVASEEPSRPGRVNSVSRRQTNEARATVGSDEEDSASESQLEDATDQSFSLQELKEKVIKLHQKAVESGNYIINYFVQRAKLSTKTGDQPHRNLLDLFAEDMINVLGSPDWPAAELLLWILARHMLAILNDERSAATPKNMALELLGWMGSAISNLLVSVKSLSESIAQQDDSVSQFLTDLADDQLRGSLRVEDTISETGPYRITLDYIRGRDQNNWQLKTAYGYYLTGWAKTYFSVMENAEDQQSIESDQFSKILLRATSDATWLETDNALPDISPHQARLAYLLTITTTSFCKTFDVIVRVLLQSLTSDQAKMRSRSLKSVISMLEADPKLLDRDVGVMNVIFRRASDSSPMVRDNALSLIAKCMSLRPALEEDATRVILERCQSDSAIGVRKRCLGLLKDISIRSSKTMAKASIARAFMNRLNDPEESVAALAQQTLVEIWLSPLLSSGQDANNSAKSEVAYKELAGLIVKTVNTTESTGTSDLLPRLEQFCRSALKDSTRSLRSVFNIFSHVVDTLFDRILNGADQITKHDQRALLSTLEALARANSSLVKPEQLQALQPYIQNLSTDDDLFFFRSVVVIYRCVLPQLADKTLLRNIQNDLMKAVSRLGRAELNEAISCLWTIDRVLHNTERLVKLTMSLLKNISATRMPAFNEASHDESFSSDIIRRLRSYLRIAGSVGKYCDLEGFANSFRDIFPSWKGTSVVGLMVDLICPLTTTKQPSALRLEALHSLASICQTWPGQFNKETIRKSFSEILDKGPSELQYIALTNFLEFFKAREAASESALSSQNGSDGDGTGRLEGSLKASDQDGAAALIAQHFLSHVIRISTSGNDQVDMPAIEVIASINRQGLVHPKECAGALVALETSPRPLLSKIAYESHLLLHQQHETMFEREYMRAILEAYVYQRDVVKDTLGAKVRPFVPKLSSLYDIVKTSNSRYIRKFLKNLVARAAVDLADLNIADETADQVIFSRFVAQNLAYFEYGKLDELVHAISYIESYVGKTGAEIAQAIEAQVVGSTIGLQDVSQGTDAVDDAATLPTRVVEPTILRRLTMAAMILTILWETRTHLRRQYGITGAVREPDGKSKDAKELSKIPTKVHGITGERFWDSVQDVMTSLNSEEAMVRQCRDFAILMTVDDEVKVAAEGDEMRESYSASVDPEPKLQPMVNGSKKPRGPGKRKSAASANSTPKKRGKPSLNGRRRSKSNFDSDDDSD
jgi:cohesin loading factor subunit SCC2